MATEQLNLLVVDDDTYALKIILTYLATTDYQIDKAQNGREALDILYKNPQKYATILLDRTMPEMDGIDVLKKIKSDNLLKSIPVILQTGLKTEKDILEGYQAGAFCYLAKPYTREMLLALIQTAVMEWEQLRFFRDENKETIDTLNLMTTGCFQFKTLNEARNLAKLLSKSCPEHCKPPALGLMELLTNAVEHGNLGITYTEKSELLNQGIWLEEVERRLNDPKYMLKNVEIHYKRNNEEIRFLIKDQGNGFNWAPYMSFSEERIFDIHGRGIAMANTMSFDSIQYLGNGNQVLAVVSLIKKE
ncbi:MAG: response regulator, partial [Desulfobacterales bacterium]|nr:response regulator [Desulfobacterales bacterium]